MKTLLITLAILTLSLGLATASTHRGFAYHKDLELCSNIHENVTFSIEANVKPSMISGYLNEANTPSLPLKCTEQADMKNFAASETTLWKCYEDSINEGQVFVDIKADTQGLVFGVVYRTSYTGEVFELYKLECKQ
ncbi:MAG: hypothetical protein Q7U04_17190 [Bacteriovorax sp.]|nr:hypothetical protein [Bacteriovorax sp.]